MDDIVTPRVPPALWKFLEHACGLPTNDLKMLPGAEIPEPARRLLVHRHDMTSTLGNFHRTALRVDVLQRRELGSLYLREVFLRAIDSDEVVEYGVIAIALEQFTAAQTVALFAGQIPLGGLLHQFQIAFQSSPIAFFSLPAGSLAKHGGRWSDGATCYGRFNQLSKPTGEPLAWIMEILPPV